MGTRVSRKGACYISKSTLLLAFLESKLAIAKWEPNLCNL